MWKNISTQFDSELWYVSYSVVQGWGSSETIIDADPLFIDAEHGNFRLQAGSPAIDSGNGCVAPELDADGNPRWDISNIDNTGNGPAVDMGAYEFQGEDGDTEITGGGC